MNAKWYLSTLLFIFTYFGIFHEEVSVPNQEIVLEFVDSEADQQDIAHTIEDLRKKLLELGVANIKIQETESNALKISYYSDAAIEDIKEALVDHNQLIVDGNSNQKEKHSSVEYTLDVYDLTEKNDLSQRNDKLVFKNGYNFDRSTIDHHYSFAKSVQVSKANQHFKTAFKAYKRNPFVKDYTSHKEPEVRAGPMV